ncbi:hypothetical protein [Phycicoccus avicenniae]|uniref:hypothetical protein n=1 Tax=Phycicoccus avicenniae TaxID=2828860 RepID=UPI003D2DE5DB
MSRLDRIVMWTIRLMLLAALGALAGWAAAIVGLDAATTAAAFTLGLGSLVVVGIALAVAAIRDEINRAPKQPAALSAYDIRSGHDYSAHNEQAAVAGKRRA